MIISTTYKALEGTYGSIIVIFMISPNCLDI